MGVIYCVGENLEEYEAEQTEEILFSQLQAIKEEMDKTEWRKVIIAYEPIWALNTGKIASADQIQEAIMLIRDWLRDHCSEETSNDTRILYGGPVTETNTENLITTDTFVSATAALTFTTCDIAHINFPKLVLGALLTANTSTTQLTVASTGDASFANANVVAANTALKTLNLTAATVDIQTLTQKNIKITLT